MPIPIAPNTTAEGREQNRRIEIVLRRPGLTPAVTGRVIDDPRVSRWCISFIGIALLAGLVWFFAPLLPGFEDWPPALAVIVALLLVVGRRQRAARHPPAPARRGTGAEASRRAPEETEEAQALRTRLTTALDLLKTSLRSRGYLYEQPWYAIIGPPGAGKTTALLNAGLRFPLAEQMGQGADRRRRRHAAVRLVVHRGRRADRHGRPLHHAGLECRGRSRRLGRVPRSAEADQAAAAAERPARSRSRSATLPRRRPPNARRMRRRSAAGSRSCRRGSACGCRSMCCSPRPT